ncbi:cadherin-23 isoform X2 [Vanessa cardui]|uniref:cadherin-23 isoform X2 n=1 Tax=Vanessa cardui TaxID=171605 RepID=UPI001F145AF7|nr:cadherin-23 isoform X2 [Vanessa cardui]
MKAKVRFFAKNAKTPPRVRLKSGQKICIQCVFWLLVCIQIVSANRPPRFLIDGRSEIVIRLKEGPDTPVGSLIYRLRGLDPDGDTLRFGIRDQVGSDILRIEAISSNEANIYLVKELDREVRDEYSFVLTLTDGNLGEGNFITQSFLLLVEDVNDNEPVFKPYPSAITVKEDAPPGVLLTVEATDLDEGAYGQVLYNLQELDGDVENFAIQTVNGKGVIRLTNRLDYERKSLYQLRVLAVDRANQGRVNTGTAAILVKVQDVEDQPPEFIVASPVTRISEDASVGTSVLQVRAIDGDRGINNRISYSIISGGEEHFDIDSSSGIVYTISPLDREDPSNSNGAYILEILATEESHMVSPLPSATTEVTIIVTDVNDEEPRFRSDRYIGEVIENAQQNTPITFLQDAIPEVFDYDQGKNGTFELYLVGDKGVFDVTPFKGINEASFLIRVNDPSFLDYESVTVMNFSLVAKEIVTKDPKMSVVPITVHIKDENDNFPEFTESLYTVSIPENCGVGTTVAWVQALDKDSDNYGTRGVRYTSLGGSIAHLLHLNPISGVITVKQAGDDNFDRELVSRHYLTVEARDDQGKGNRNTVQLIINIEDVNDNAPMFLANKYEARLLENELEFENPLVLEARDIDLNGTKNSHIEYSIVGGDYRKNFSIDPNLGIITPVGGIDFEQLPGDNSNIRPIHLTVRARDFGSPPLSSTVPVSVYVHDVNDHAPLFTQAVYRRAIPEDMPGGTSVLEVKARDGDGSAANSALAYRIQRGAGDKFVMDSRSGLVSVASGSSLDPDRTDPKTTRYTLTVVALDGGIGDQQLSASVIVNITIVDVNNKPPVLIEPGVVHVMENTQVGTTIYKAQAYDLDEQPVLRFAIDKSASYAKNEDGVPVSLAEYDYLSLWDLNTIDGTLKVVRLLDREKVEIIKLAITVEDMAAIDDGPKQTASAMLTIVVEDENDNNPKFRKPFYKTSITENSKQGMHIETVIADDADKNRTMTYYLEELRSFLHMESATGEVVVANRIDHEMYSWLNVTVKAVDSGVPSRYAVVDLFIQVLDENDNNPIFEPSPFEFRVREDAEPGTTVANIVAKDADAGDYGKITYLLDRVSTQGKFLINADTGALKVSDWLDRESQSVYNLVVEAWDNYQFGYLSGESRNAFKQIIVYVEDVNDNPPVLSLPLDCVTLTEFHNHREAIVSITATDADDNNTPNGRVQFHLVAGKGHELFRFEQVGGDANTGRLFAKQSLKDRFGNYTLIVEARDLGIPANVVRGDLHVCVTDYNDHAPIFVHPPQNVTIKVPENATIGTTVIEVRAIDADIGPNGAVRYRLRQDAQGAWRAFALQATSGALRTAKSFDRDKQTTYQLRIEAYDLGLPTPLSSDLDLTVYIQNVDNYRPRFPYKHIHLNVTENVQDYSAYLPSVIERDEIDRGDEPMLPVCYYIVEGNDGGMFEVDRNTHRLTAKALDREEKDQYLLTILASEDCMTKPNYEERLDAMSTLKVHIIVNDVNDNSPQFVTKIFTGGVTTEADFGIEFMHVKAVDSDEGINAKISYYLLGDVKETLTEGLENLAVSPFLVNVETGAVSLNFDPQKGMKGYFDFKVLANDTDGLQDEAHVFIYLLREDQRVRFVLRSHPSEIRDKINTFREKLARVTDSVVNIDDLRVHENKDGSVDNTKTDLYLHLVNGEDHSVLEVDQVLKLVDKNIEQLDDLFKEFNVLDTQPAEFSALSAERLSSSQAVYWLAWSSLLLGALLLLSVLAALAQRADYARRLKAATATAYYKSFQHENLHFTVFRASPTPGESDMTIRSSGGRVPNTNKHSTKGSNPIWLHAYENDWYKSDDQISHSERDSLDENAVDQDMSNEKPYFITTAAFPSIRSTETEPEADQGNYDFYQQLEQMKNAKNMETTEL